MSAGDIFKKSFLEGYASGALTIGSIAACLGIAGLLGIYIFFAYRLLCRREFLNKNFSIALIALAEITAAIILTVQSNVVISLGMVGALSIVRFRTAIKEPLDIAFLFWAIAAGIVLAAGFIPLAVIGSVIIGVILLLFANRKSSSNPYIVVLSCDGAESEAAATEFLKAHTKRCTVKSKTARKGVVELNVEVRLNDADTGFVNALSDLAGVRSAVLVSYNGDYMG